MQTLSDRFPRTLSQLTSKIGAQQRRMHFEGKAAYLDMFVSLCLLVLLLNCPCSYALYEDQVGKFDWRQQFIGGVFHAAFPEKDNHRVYVGTDKGVLAALNIKTGDILWRNILQRDGQFDFISFAEDVASLNEGGRRLRYFDGNSGVLLWEKQVQTETSSFSKMLRVNKLLVVMSGNSLEAFDSRGSSRWKQSISPSKGDCFDFDYHERTGSVFVVYSRDETTLTSLKFNANDGEAIGLSEAETILAPWLSKRCILQGARLLCRQLGSLHSVNLNSLSSSHTSLHIDETADDQMIVGVKFLSSGDFLAQISAEKLTIYSVVDDRITPTKDVTVDHQLVSVTEFDQNLILTTSKPDRTGLLWYSLKEGKLSEEKTFRSCLGDEIAAISQIFGIPRAKHDRLVVVGSDNSISLVLKSGEIVWSRQEALASIVSVEMLDLPLSEAQADIEKEFTAQADNIVGMFVKRIVSQAVQMKHAAARLSETLVTTTMSLTNSVLNGESLTAGLFGKSGPKSSVKSRLERDYFNLHKIIVAVTRVGKVFGIDNRDGSIVWQRPLPQLSAFFNKVERKSELPLFVLRTTAHFPYPPSIALMGKLSEESTVIVELNPITGNVEATVSLDCAAQQAFLLPHSTAEFLNVLLVVCKDRQLKLYPADTLKDLDRFWVNNVFTFAPDGEDGRLQGYRVNFSHKQLSLEHVWSNTVGSGPKEELLSISMKRASERVHSQGRVLGDRSVLYKYLNPNLAVLVVKSSDVEGKTSSITINLMDVITGQVIFETIHKRARGPVHVIHCENWVVYSYWNEKSRRTEFSVLELYEGKSQFDANIFSSFRPPPLPLVVRQAYVFPNGVSAMTVTETEKGITSRLILVAMPFGGILQLPKMFLDPRRSMFPTPEQREEGLIPYIPELPIATEHILNYNLTVLGAEAIHTSHSGLESTSLVFAYGLDLFYTRITPSGTFDILKDDFDHWLITAVLLALLVASYASKRLARHRDLQQAWK